MTSGEGIEISRSPITTTMTIRTDCPFCGSTNITSTESSMRCGGCGGTIDEVALRSAEKPSRRFGAFVGLDTR